MAHYRKYSVRAPHRSGADPSSDVYVEDFLYDLDADPHEKNNLVANPDQPLVALVRFLWFDVPAWTYDGLRALQLPVEPFKPCLSSYNSWPPTVVSVMLFDFRFWDDYDKAFEHER
jgi:hypothetical protein